jgi:hypothetical protein
LAITTQIFEKTAISVYESNYYRNLLFNLSLLSTESKENIVVQRKNSEEVLKIRPTIHIAQITPFGDLKTTSANRMMEYLASTKSDPKCHKVSNATAPAVAGSIDEKGRITYPLNANFKNGTIFIDEFKTGNNEKSDVIGCMLDVLENEECSRVTARLPKKSEKSRAGAEVEYEVAGGRIWFKGLRSNWIFFTAKNLKMNREPSMAMLVSRTIPILFNPTWDELDAIDDNPDLLFKGLNLRLPKFETIDNNTYQEIRRYVRKYLTENLVPQSYYFRTVCDLIRCYVMNGFQHNWDLYQYVLAGKKMFALTNSDIIDILELNSLSEFKMPNGLV